MTVGPDDVIAFWFEDAMADAAALERRYRAWFSAEVTQMVLSVWSVSGPV